MYSDWQAWANSIECMQHHPAHVHGLAQAFALHWYIIQMCPMILAGDSKDLEQMCSLIWAFAVCACTTGTFLAHLSMKCSRWVIVVSQCLPSIVHCPSSVVPRAASTICFKSLLLLHPWASWLETWLEALGWLEIAKIVPIGNPNWPQWLPS